MAERCLQGCNRHLQLLVSRQVGCVGSLASMSSLKQLRSGSETRICLTCGRRPGLLCEVSYSSPATASCLMHAACVHTSVSGPGHGAGQSMRRARTVSPSQATTSWLIPCCWQSPELDEWKVRFIKGRTAWHSLKISLSLSLSLFSHPLEAPPLAACFHTPCPPALLHVVH